jgi:hypothetical protein
MEKVQIESMEDWLRWKRRIVEAGFTLWQTQYGWDQPDGMIAGFINVNDEQKFEIVTHNKKIAEDISSSNLSGL